MVKATNICDIIDEYDVKSLTKNGCKHYDTAELCKVLGIRDVGKFQELITKKHKIQNKKKTSWFVKYDAVYDTVSEYRGKKAKDFVNKIKNCDEFKASIKGEDMNEDDIIEETASEDLSNEDESSKDETSDDSDDGNEDSENSRSERSSRSKTRRTKPDKSRKRTRSPNKSNKNKVIPDHRKYPIIRLLKFEKFYYKKKVINIEVRGCRIWNKCFFYLKDVATGFGIANLRNTVTNKRGGYTKGTHYVHLKVPREQDDGQFYPQTCIYLTYEGLLRVLFTTRNKKTTGFVGWACCKLFTLHMGEDADRKKIANGIYGITADVAKAVFSKSATTMCGMYWYAIADTEDVRNDLDIGPEFEDGMLVSKFGESEDVMDRGVDHRDSYGKLPGARVKLMFFAYIDPIHVKKAEASLREYFEATGMLHTCKGHNELFIIKKNQTTIEKIKKEFQKIALMYGGHAKDLNHKISDLEAQIEITGLKHSENVAKIAKEYGEKMAALQLENMELKKDKELLIKDNEILSSKLKRRDKKVDALSSKVRELEDYIKVQDSKLSKLMKTSKKGKY